MSRRRRSGAEAPQSDLSEKRRLRAHSPRRQRRREERLSRPIMALSMTPMIDVVFQLLVFFLVAARFAGNEEIFRVDLPRLEQREGAAEAAAGEGGGPEDPFEPDREALRILVTSTGPGVDDCRLELVGPFRQPQSFAELRTILASMRVDPSSRSGLFLATHPVVLEPSPATSWEHSVEAFNAAVRAGYTNVIFQALPEWGREQGVGLGG